MRLGALHHRLSTFGGHRYYEGLGLVDESRRRGWDLDLLVSVYAREPVLRGLGSDARSVLCDPAVKLMPSDEIEPHEITFVCCIEGTAIEAQALVLCASIRRFGGVYATSPIVAVNPRPIHPISAHSERRLADLGCRYVCEPLNETGSPYLTINRIVTGSWAESHLDTAYIVLLDSDMLFVRAPSFRRADVGVRPVDMKGSASTGIGDPLDPYWSAMSEIAGISPDALPYVTASIEGTRLRASYNGGFCIARRSLGIFREVRRVFEESRLHDLRPLRDRGVSVFASTGHVGLDASEWWGSSQAAMSVAIHASTRDVLVYDERYNVPLNLITDSDGEFRWPKLDIVLLHYHWLLGAEYRDELLNRMRVLGIGDDVIAWLSSTATTPMRSTDA